jgi:hypothetical protein
LPLLMDFSTESTKLGLFGFDSLQRIGDLMQPHGAGHGKGQGYNSCMCGYCRAGATGNKRSSNVGVRAILMKSAQKAERRDARTEIKQELEDAQSDEFRPDPPKVGSWV